MVTVYLPTSAVMVHLTAQTILMSAAAQVINTALFAFSYHSNKSVTSSLVLFLHTCNFTPRTHLSYILFAFTIPLCHTIPSFLVPDFHLHNSIFIFSLLNYRFCSYNTTNRLTSNHNNVCGISPYITSAFVPVNHSKTIQSNFTKVMSC